MQEVNPRQNSKMAGLAFSVAAVVFILISFVVSLILDGAEVSETSDLYKYCSYLVAPVAIAVACFATLRYSKQMVREVVPVKCNFKYYIIALLMIFGLLFCVSKLNSLTLEFLKLFGYTPREESSYLPKIDGALILPVIIVIAVLPALFEEFLFRGLLLNNLHAQVGTVRTVFLVGFCFSLFHGSAEQTVYQFVCGCAFAFLAVRSGSILPCVLMHFLNNALIIILYACGATDASGSLAVSQTGDIVLVVFGGVAFIGSVLWLVFDNKNVQKCVKGGVSNFFIWASVGIAVLAIIWVSSLFIR